MAKACPDVIEALRATARALEKATDYQWGHMGACNCGFLARQVTAQSREEIHNHAMLRYGDWSEQLNDYCPESGMPMDALIDQLIAFGFSITDLKHLERLSDKTILESMPVEHRHLKHNVKEDVIRYLRAWAGLLEIQWLENTKVPAIDEPIRVPA
ncbi:MAG: hypothetical protein NZM13_10785 [Cyclobacteriaceae bacterium]|nr:hypothetical protein [Cyclobacteriaceae bacterium]